MSLNYIYKCIIALLKVKSTTTQVMLYKNCIYIGKLYTCDKVRLL